MIWIDELAKRLNITSSAIRCINKKKIRTLNTAKKYIRNFNKILKEEAENNTKYNKSDIVEIEEAENKELLRLIDYLLSQMSQIDLSIRSWIAQSTLSYIYNRKILMKRNSIRDYIYRLKKVEAAILWIALTNNKL
jgi:formate dehydrogenase maturation protein FdhE